MEPAAGAGSFVTVFKTSELVISYVLLGAVVEILLPFLYCGICVE